jgi:hypothetical protein
MAMSRRGGEEEKLVNKRRKKTQKGEREGDYEYLNNN